MGTFFHRFSTTAVQIAALDPGMARSALMNALAESQFKIEIFKNPPATYAELLREVAQQVHAEEAVRATPRKDKGKVEKFARREAALPGRRPNVDRERAPRPRSPVKESFQVRAPHAYNPPERPHPRERARQEDRVVTTPPEEADPRRM